MTANWKSFRTPHKKKCLIVKRKGRERKGREGKGKKKRERGKGERGKESCYSYEVDEPVC